MTRKVGIEKKRIQKSIQKVDNSYSFPLILERKLQNITEGIRPAFLNMLYTLSEVNPALQYNRFVYSQEQFKVDENPDYVISIQYPNDWSISEDNLAAHKVAAFSAPEVEEEESSVSTVIYIPAELILAVQPLSSPNMTLRQFADQFLKETYPSPTDYRIKETSNTTFAGMNAQKIVMYEYIGEKNSKVMRTIGIANGTAYMIKYLAEPGQFSAYLPVAQTMIDSFQPSLTRTSVSAEPRPSLSSSVNGTSVNNGRA